MVLNYENLSEIGKAKFDALTESCPEEFIELFSAGHSAFVNVGATLTNIKTGEETIEPNYIEIMGDGFDGKGGQYYVGGCRLQIDAQMKPVEGAEWHWTHGAPNQPQ